jgi:ubiquinone/menaquinone biosynthesis C-methylase UbiE
LKLDYGCGSGGFQEITGDRKHLDSWLLKHGGTDAVGIDVNPDKIYLAYNRIGNGTQFICCDGKQLPFSDGSFNLVHEVGVLHHIENYTEGLKEIHRVMEPSGVLYLVEAVDNDFIYRLCRRIKGRWQGDSIHSFFTTYELDKQLKRYFTIVDRKYYWRYVVSDLLREYNAEPAASLYFNDYMSQFLNKIRFSKYSCCHYVVKAIKE